MTQYGNVSAARAFEGMEDAQVTDSNPKLPPMGEFLLEIVDLTLINGYETGITFVIEHKVLETDIPERCKVGGLYATTITKLDGPDAKLKKGKVRNFIAALLRKDENAQEKWGEIGVYVVENKSQLAVGQRVRARTGESKLAKKSGKPFTPVTFSPA